MKKIFLIFVFSLLFPLVAGAGLTDHLKSVAKKKSTGATPTYVFHLEFDADTDWTDGTYTMGGNDTSAGDTTGTISNTSHFTQSTTQANSGGYSATMTPTVGCNMAFDVSNDDIFDPDVGYMTLYVYVDDSIAGDTFVTNVRPGSNRFDIKIGASSATVERRGGDGTNIVTNTSADALTGNAWNRIDVRWSVANNDLDIRINSGTWDTLDSSMTAFNTAPGAGDFKIGGITVGERLYIDDVSVWSDFTGPGD